MGSIPIVHYNPHFLLGENVPFWIKVIGVGVHASSIVGRRVSNDKYEYLLRNSWGPSCSSYAPKYNKVCEAGHFWIKEADLRREVTSVTYLL